MKHRLINAARAFLGRPVSSFVSEPRGHLGIFNRAALHRILFISDLFRRVEKVPGAVVECGVGQGRGLAVWTSLVLLEKTNRKVWAFDSFKGFPALAAEDEATMEFERGLEEYRQFDIPYVRQTLLDFGLSPVDIDRQITMIKGFIPDSLKNYDSAPVALLYVDLDIYEGYRDSLAFFYDKVSPGGVIAFDEYFKPLDTHKWPGAAKAINEFLDSRGLRKHLERDPLTGNAYFIKTRD